MEKLTQKWSIAAFFDDLEGGYEFHRKDTSLHVTLASVFAIDIKGLELSVMLSDLIKGQESFVIEAEEDELWGDYKEIRVVLIKESIEMSKLLMQIYEFLLTHGVVFNQPNYEGNGHKLHSTVQKSGRLNNGQKVTINKLSLVDMFPNSDGMRRRIVKTIYF